MAMEGIAGRVEIENDLFWRPIVRADEEVDEHGLDRPRSWLIL
jgi:hypothetical protein